MCSGHVADLNIFTSLGIQSEILGCNLFTEIYDIYLLFHWRFTNEVDYYQILYSYLPMDGKPRTPTSLNIASQSFNIYPPLKHYQIVHITMK